MAGRRHRRRPTTKRAPAIVRRTYLRNLARLASQADTRLEKEDARRAILAHHRAGDITRAAVRRLLGLIRR